MIEFPCVCGKLLGVGTELAGRRARCPACGTANTVPTDGPRPFPGAPPAGAFERRSTSEAVAAAGAVAGAAAASFGLPSSTPATSYGDAAPLRPSRSWAPAPTGASIHPLSIAGFIIGFTGFFCLPAPVGLILSIVGVRETARHPARYSGIGLGIAGIVMNAFWTLLALFMLLAAFATPSAPHHVPPPQVVPPPTVASVAPSAEAACLANLSHLATLLDIHRAEKRAFPAGAGARFLDQLERYGRDRMPKLAFQTRAPRSTQTTRTSYRGPARALPANAPAATPVVADWSDEHPGGVLHVLYADGRVVTLRPGTPEHAAALEATQ